jgi:peptide/nickel transport system permease protein/oligopeptide transport system permease protein
MLSEAVRFYTLPHFVIFPGLAIFITVLAFNLFGDGLRDAFDPRAH